MSAAQGPESISSCARTPLADADVIFLEADADVISLQADANVIFLQADAYVISMVVVQPPGKRGPLAVPGQLRRGRPAPVLCGAGTRRPALHGLLRHGRPAPRVSRHAEARTPGARRSAPVARTPTPGRPRVSAVPAVPQSRRADRGPRSRRTRPGRRRPTRPLTPGSGHHGRPCAEFLAVLMGPVVFTMFAYVPLRYTSGARRANAPRPSTPGPDRACPASSRSSERHAHRLRDLPCGRGANQASPARPAGTAIGPSVAALRRCPRDPVGTGLRGAVLPGSDSHGNWAALTNEGLRGTVGRHAKGRIPAEIRVIPAEIRVTTRFLGPHSTGPVSGSPARKVLSGATVQMPLFSCQKLPSTSV